MQGGREETGKIPLEQRAETAVGPSGPPPLPGIPEWPERLRPGKKSGTAEVCAFVSLQRQGRFCFEKGEAYGHELSQMRRSYGEGHHVLHKNSLLDSVG